MIVRAFAAGNSQMFVRGAIALVFTVVSACASSSPLRPEVEARSLAGAPLSRPPLDDKVRIVRERALADARARHDRDPTDVEAAIWYGRRLAYLGRFREAIDVFTRAMRIHPDDARLYRHRGHRYITVRNFDRAIADLEHAATLRAGKPDELEPDGLPNAANIPTSTLHDNIWYHLGLARYLTRDFVRAEGAYREAMRTATNDDMRVATGYWLYLALRQLGRHDDARAFLATLPVSPQLLENHAYFALLRLFRGEAQPWDLATTGDLDRETLGYGVAMWHVFAGHRDQAEAALRATASGSWPAFAAVAAEAELSASSR